MTVIVGNDHFGQEMGSERKKSDIHDNPLLKLLQITCLKGKKRREKKVSAREACRGVER